MYLRPGQLGLEIPRQMLNQHFAVMMTPNDFQALMQGSPLLQDRNPDNRPTIHDAVSTLAAPQSNKYQIYLDVQHFYPEELTVKVVDRVLVIEGQHGERCDNQGSVARHFIRRYPMPDECNVNAVESTLSLDGVLTISAPLGPSCDNEHCVPIVNTNCPVKKRAPPNPCAGEPREKGR